MARPYITRQIRCRPGARLFKPEGLDTCNGEVVQLDLDELEALRLVDLDGLDQAHAGEQMGVSRATVGRILCSARRKIAGALLNGQALCIAQGAAPVQNPPAPPGQDAGP